MVLYKRAETDEELQEILKLQKKNLLTNLSDEEKKKEGFVTVSHSLGILKQMNAICPHIIAVYQNNVIGYALCMHPKFANAIDALQPMFIEINKVLPLKTNFMVMGQICIDKSHRGQGLFRNLYATMTKALQPYFKTIITEVDATNTRSLGAHYNIDFKDLTTHMHNGQEWKIIILN